MGAVNVLSSEVAEFRADGVDEIIAKVRQYKAETDSLTESVKAQQSANEKMLKVASGSSAGSNSFKTITPDIQKVASLLGKGADSFAVKMKAAAKAVAASTAEMVKKVGQTVSSSAKSGAGVGTVGPMTTASGFPGLSALSSLGIGALATRGLSGTIEGNKMDREIELLSREVAGIAKPMTDSLTKTVRNARMKLEEQSRHTQDHLLAAGVVATATTASYFSPAILGFMKRIPQAMVALKLADVGKTMYDTADFGMIQHNQVYGKGIGVSRDDSARFGYRGMTQQQRTAEEEKVDEALAMHGNFSRSFKGQAEMYAGSLLKTFNYDPFGFGKSLTSHQENAAAGIELYRRKQELENIANGTPEKKADESRRRLTPDNISYGELGSSYEEATLGLMKLNATDLDEGNKNLADAVSELTAYLKARDGSQNSMKNLTY